MKNPLFAHSRRLGYSLLSLLVVLAVSFVVFSHTSFTQAQTVSGQEAGDHDEDGHENNDDVDDDSDGFPDCVEKDFFRHDHDNDGIKDGEDTDDDNDGIEDEDDTEEFDHDNDGSSDKIENRLTSVSKDEDRDGIPDQKEQKKFRNDHDNDELKNGEDTDDDSDGIADAEEETVDRKDHDNDSDKDRHDLDDDNDGIRDFNEESCDEIDDHDNDGIGDDEDENDDGEDEDEPEQETVSIDNMAFADEEVTISVGDSILWTNNDSVSHTVTSDDGAFDSGQLEAGDTFALDFQTAGTYTYHCDIHPEMTGTVVVEAADEED